MRTFSGWMLGLMVAAAAGCKGGGDRVAIPVAPGAEIAIQAESFKLDEAKVASLAGASGGKAILFDSETASAEFTIPMLVTGTYEVIVYAQGKDEDHDAVFLNFGGDERRVFPSEYGQVLPTQAESFDLPKDGPCKVVLMAAETDVYIDRVVVRKVK